MSSSRESDNNTNEQTPLLTTDESHPDTKKISSMVDFWTIGSLYGASAVALGAFGAHGLKRRITDPGRIANWGTAAHYQVIHSLALIVSSQLAPANTTAQSLFTAGMTMFSGSIYMLVLDPQRFKFLGPVTPLGGLCLIGGWVALAFGNRGAIKR